MSKVALEVVRDPHTGLTMHVFSCVDVGGVEYLCELGNRLELRLEGGRHVVAMPYTDEDRAAAEEKRQRLERNRGGVLEVGCA